MVCLLNSTAISLYSVFEKEACGSKLLVIECGVGQKIRIKGAAWGVFSNGNSCGYTHETKCVASNSKQVYWIFDSFNFWFFYSMHLDPKIKIFKIWTGKKKCWSSSLCAVGCYGRFFGESKENVVSIRRLKNLFYSHMSAVCPPYPISQYANNYNAYPTCLSSNVPLDLEVIFNCLFADCGREVRW